MATEAKKLNLNPSGGILEKFFLASGRFARES